jgi:hypothetical protein
MVSCVASCERVVCGKQKCFEKQVIQTQSLKDYYSDPFSAVPVKLRECSYKLEVLIPVTTLLFVICTSVPVSCPSSNDTKQCG